MLLRVEEQWVSGGTPRDEAATGSTLLSLVLPPNINKQAHALSVPSYLLCEGRRPSSIDSGGSKE